jgi:hypothetical protein
MIIFAKTTGKTPRPMHTPDDHLRAAMIIDGDGPMAIYA